MLTFEASPSIAILTPMRDMPTPEYTYAVTHNSPRASVLQVRGLPVDAARNALVRAVLDLKPRPEFVVWADDDSYWLPGTIERLIGNLGNNPLIALITGWCGNRSLDSGTNIIRIVDDPYAIAQAPVGVFSSNAIVVERIAKPTQPFGSGPALVPCDFIASHFMMHRTALLDVLEVDPFTPTEGRPGPEDFEFCGRVREAGGTIAADVTLPIWHMGVALIDGIRRSVGFVPTAQPCEIVNGIPTPVAGILKRVDDHRAYGPAVSRKLDTMGRDLIWRMSKYAA